MKPEDLLLADVPDFRPAGIVLAPSDPGQHTAPRGLQLRTDEAAVRPA
jgi:hypothetical protein